MQKEGFVLLNFSSKILQDIITLYNNQSQVSTQAKISSFKNPHIKIDLLLLLPRGAKIP
jgi:hypothetical protein